MLQLPNDSSLNPSSDALPQPPPEIGQQVVLHAVLVDLIARAEAGNEKYGTYLMTHNGRKALVDAYQEALDLCMYLKQSLLEEEVDRLNK